MKQLVRMGIEVLLNRLQQFIDKRLRWSSLVLLAFVCKLLILSTTASAVTQNDYGTISKNTSNASALAIYATCQWIGYNEESNTITVQTFLSTEGHPETTQLELTIASDAMIFDGEKAMRIPEIPKNALVDIEFDAMSQIAQFILVHQPSI